MVIQSNMSPKEISKVWLETEKVFSDYNIPLTVKPLYAIVNEKELPSLLESLNSVVGSSSATCIEGG